jgi:DNA invertase Pin-like site-specific DNA recombinase
MSTTSPVILSIGNPKRITSEQLKACTLFNHEETMSSEDEERDYPISSGKTAPSLVPKVSVLKSRTATYRGAGGSGEEYLPAGSGRGVIFAYVRRSAEDRSQRPLAAQIEIIDKYVKDCLSHLGGAVRIYFGDNGVSGSTAPEKRDGMTALFTALHSVIEEIGHSSAHVVVYDASRLARSINIGSQVKNMLERIGATLHLAQNRMLVEGANAELFFGLNLQLAASERTATISRVRASLRNRPDWDPRKSLGWKFDGAGTVPVELPEEQQILTYIRKMFEVDGKKVAEIAKIVQTEFGPRRRRRPGDLGKNDWTSTEISFLSRKHKWVWGGGPSIASLEAELDTMPSEEIKGSVEHIFHQKQGQYYDGVKINRAMLRHLIGVDGIQEWRFAAIKLAQQLLKQEKHSNDDIVNMLNENTPRPGLMPGDPPRGWPRQTGWRVIQDAQKLNDKATLRITRN